MAAPETLSTTQEQILNAVLSCLAEGGIAGVSMRAVAAEADVSLGLLNYHFAGKQALIAEAVQLACNRLVGDSLASIDGVVGADDRVRAFIRGAAADEFLSSEYLRLRLVIWSAARLHPDIGVADLCVYQEYVDRTEKLIREARPGLSAEDAHQRADDVSTNKNGLWLHWARFRDRETLERGLRRCEDIALGAG
jgi:AcrR family transcriptional regulator